jgi:hypothetical protein
LLRAWLAVIVAVIGLASMRAAYDLTYEPAPSVRVRWRDGTGPWGRTWLEHKYRLVDPAAPQGLSYAYVLMDTSEVNIRAMVTDPVVADTGDIDREKFEVPWETAYVTRERMWAADRTPGLRQPTVRYAVLAALVAALAFGVMRILGALRVRYTNAAFDSLRRAHAAPKHG